MANPLENWNRTIAKNQEDSAALVQKLFDVARPEAVFGQPLTVGEQVVITASEVAVGVGIGFGGGVGTSGQPEDEESENENAGGGAGGGGGGASSARPVATIVVSPQGVWVEPIVDVTKLGLALFTMLGSMWMFWSRMRRASRD